MPFDLLTLLELVVVAGAAWWLIGGWASLRQPQVFVPLLVVIACVAAAAWASAGIDAVRAGEERPLGAVGLGRLVFGAMVVGVLALGWGLLAGYRLRRQRGPAGSPSGA